MIGSDGYIPEPNFENYKLLCMNPIFIKLRVETNKLEAFDYDLINSLEDTLFDEGYSYSEIDNALMYGRNDESKETK